eukprot:CAMPEP_0202865996 /NCGR_PEP_ID=MMETSP1391-20130828/6931_1 /ASSEMBLY_ACC=CAM_ASM_000867 /TAXON_ID=1034604 /ORGANISM="Chlamydomonas leiostraca, Strain SAG 11-49" /LENGTH=290 /DNA_ID=CAMNT_0049545897 /DNA_START=81 /DNA_END=953 /DNA_ORIENTATION=+
MRLAASQKTALARRASSLVCHVLEKPGHSSASVATTSGLRQLSTTSPAPCPAKPYPALSPEIREAMQTHMGGPLNTGHMVPPPKPVVIIISGPSGVGKDTVVARLKERREDLYFVVTATSRPKRPSEVEGRDYFFVTKEKFEEWIANDMLLENALVYGEYKGIPRQQVDDALKAGTDVVLRIDVQGAATVKKLMPEAISIFVAAENEECLVGRLAARNTESMDKLAVRVATARSEVARIGEFDYVVVNGTGQLEQCVAQVSGIIDAEKARTCNRMRRGCSGNGNGSASSA